MSKKRILILSGIFKADLMGGPATLLDPLIRELIKRGYQVQVLAFGQPEKNDYPYSVKKVSHCWPYFLKISIYFLKALWLSLRTDILYNQDLYTSGLVSMLVKKITGKPLITRFVGESAWETAVAQGQTKDDIITFQEKKYSQKIELRKKARSKILESSDKIIVVSNFLRDLAIKIGLPQDKIKVIYNSVDFLETANLPDKQRLREKFGLQGKILLTIARLTPWKGVDGLIELMPDLIKKYQQISLVIIGQGQERARLEELAKSLNLGNSVQFLGKLPHQQTLEYLKAADLFVLNTNYEGMSYALLEAMKIGTPIVTTSAGGNPETIKNGQTGLLVGYNNKEEWLRAISSILDNPDLAQRLVNQAKEDLKRFSWTNLVQETIKVFQECIGK